MDNGFLDTVVLGNPISRYLIMLGVFLTGMLVVLLVKLVFSGRLRRWVQRKDTPADPELFAKAERNAILTLHTLNLGLCLFILDLGAKTGQFLSSLLLLVGTILTLNFLTSLTYFLLDLKLKRKGRSLEDFKGRAFMPIIKGVVWTLATVFFLDNMGFQVSSVIAGLGIAGIAVGLAGQAILGDLFSYFAILWDRPFRLGDLVYVGDVRGYIEYVGLKTTRLRSLDGEEIVMSNSDLTGSRLRNYQRMRRRRVVFGFGVVYQTRPEVLEAIPDMVKEIINGVPRTQVERVHFKEFGDFSLNFEVVYHVLSKEYDEYMDAMQAINLALAKEFEKRSIEFAYPTQTLFWSKAGSGKSSEEA